MSGNHSARKHSKFAASAAERWGVCYGSVALSENIPSRSSVWSREGESGHEWVEAVLRFILSGKKSTEELLKLEDKIRKSPDRWTHKQVEAIKSHGSDAADFLIGQLRSLPDADFLMETRVYLDFIHPEMFGTFDSAVIDHFGTLNVYDYKYGAGHAVSPKKNLQMAFYGVGLAHRYNWNFKKVRLWIIQPRIKGYDGPTFWELSIDELKGYADKFAETIKMIERFPNKLVEGGHCHWCPARQAGKCPLKQEKKATKAKSVFLAKPL